MTSLDQEEGGTAYHQHHINSNGVTMIDNDGDNGDDKDGVIVANDNDDNRKERPWWKGHATPMWAVGTAYLLLFIAYLGLAKFGHKSAAFILHTLFALTFCVACAANLFHTPSHGPSYRIQHRWLGWTAVWSGTAVVGSGYYMVLNSESQLSDTANTLFMSTGALQIVLQVGLVVAIRYYKAVWYHMMMACILFYAAALMPAVNRAPNIFHFPDSDTFTIAIMPLPLFLVFFAIRYYSIQMDKTTPSSSS